MDAKARRNQEKEGNSLSFLLFPGVLEYGYSINDKWDIAIALEEEATFVGDYDINVVSLEPYARFTFAKVGFLGYRRYEATEEYPDAGTYNSFGFNLDGDLGTFSRYNGNIKDLERLLNMKL